MLDGLRDRLSEYHGMGARFAKWRAVIRITDKLPSVACVSAKDRLASAHLNAINRLPGPKPWKLSFSYGRALQDEAMAAWHGRDENLKAGQQAFLHRARCNGAATRGEYTDAMEAA